MMLVGMKLSGQSEFVKKRGDKPGLSVRMTPRQEHGHTSTIGNVRELTKQRRKSGDAVDLEWLAA